MIVPQALTAPDPTLLWWLAALLTPVLVALLPTGAAQKGGRP